MRGSVCGKLEINKEKTEKEKEKENQAHSCTTSGSKHDDGDSVRLWLLFSSFFILLLMVYVYVNRNEYHSGMFRMFVCSQARTAHKHLGNFVLYSVTPVTCMVIMCEMCLRGTALTVGSIKNYYYRYYYNYCNSASSPSPLPLSSFLFIIFYALRAAHSIMYVHVYEYGQLEPVNGTTASVLPALAVLPLVVTRAQRMMCDAPGKLSRCKLIDFAGSYVVMGQLMDRWTDINIETDSQTSASLDVLGVDRARYVCVYSDILICKVD